MSDHPHSIVEHQFDDMAQQKETTTLAMWAFLLTEVLFFGGLFGAYTMLRHRFPEAFAVASNSLDLTLGAVNTAVLIGSSLTMALAVHAAQTNKRKQIILFLVLTIALGSVFLGIKAVEYSHKFHEHHVPGASFSFTEVPDWVDPATLSYNVENATQMFFSLYFAMTGLHALHMVIGVGIMLVMIWMAYKNRFSEHYYGPVEISGLYWHFVDIVWIFLFPLLYLLGRHFGGGH